MSRKNRMEDIKLDIAHNSIVLAKWFSKKAQKIGSDEYIKLHEIMKENPGFKIKEHTIRTNSTKERYKGLNYKRMRKYINTYVPEAEREQTIKEFEKQIDYTSMRSSKYPAVKKWFLDSFPEVKKNYGKVAELDA